MNFMKRAGFVLTCATMLANLCAAQNTERTTQGMKCTTQGMDIRVEFYSPSIVRVYKTPEGKPYNKESLELQYMIFGKSNKGQNEKKS